MALPKYIRQHIANALSAAKGVRSSFAMPNETLIFNGKEYNVDDFVKARIRLHHDTWICRPLQCVLEWDNK